MGRRSFSKRGLRDIIFAMKCEIDIHDIGVHGEAIGSLEGLTLFVQGGLPGERLEVEIEKKKKNYATGRLLKILKSSEHRVEPICPLFGVCGGCQIMHLSYKEQLAIKRKKVVDAIERIGKIKDAEVFPCEPSPEEWGYRNKLQLPVTVGPKIGLYARGSHRVIPVERCFLHNTSGETLLKEIKRVVARSPISLYEEKSRRGELRHLLIKSAVKKGGTLVTLITTRQVGPLLKQLAKEIFQLPGVVGVVHALNDREDNAVRGDVYTTLEGQGWIEEEILGLSVQISAPSFFQVNTHQAEKMYQKAAELAEVVPGSHLVDAYSGIGTFALFLASFGAQVTGIECVEEATRDAKSASKRNQIPATFLTGRVEDLIGELPQIDMIFLNPPRKGCEESVLREIVRRDIPKIIYTSCDPATLARDLSYLYSRGYNRISVYPFDMFPQTMHVESVALIERK